MEIPPQYKAGFKKKVTPEEVIPVKERDYGEYIGETMILDSGADFMGTFEGTCKTPEGLVFYFSKRVAYSPKGECRVEESGGALFRVITTSQPIVKTVPETLEELADNHNAAREKDNESK